MSLTGRAMAAEINRETAGRVARVKARRIQPCLVFIRVGEDPASQVYVAMKEKAAAPLGIASQTHVLPATASEGELLALVGRLNADRAVHGILVQAPLPRQMSEMEDLQRGGPEQGRGRFSSGQRGQNAAGGPDGVPLLHAGGDTRDAAALRGEDPGAEAVILGRGNIVGKPMAALLLQKSKKAGATVTICHSQTRGLAAHCRRADILIAAMGVAEFVKAPMVKPGAVVIDVGVNRVADPAARGGWRLVGDVDFAAVRPVAGQITPNPGGVGPMTIALLMQNTVRAAELAAGLATDD